ncbi:MAG: thioredoxin [Ardenticatenales bacterium]|nr:thioredoxin [Ardenticatenales bacterium]
MGHNSVVVTDADFEAEVLKSDMPVLVDFWAEWCGPCKMLGPVVEEIAGETVGQLKVAKLDIDENQQASFQFGVRSIPTLILFKNGREAERLVGYMPKERILAKLEPHLTPTLVS